MQLLFIVNIRLIIYLLNFVFMNVVIFVFIGFSRTLYNNFFYRACKNWLSNIKYYCSISLFSMTKWINFFEELEFEIINFPCFGYFIQNIVLYFSFMKVGILFGQVIFFTISFHMHTMFQSLSLNLFHLLI